MMFIHTICNALKKADVPYAIVGGYAVSLHGAVRGTTDVDLAIRWSLENLQKFEKAFREIGLVSRLPINSESVYHFRDEYIQNRNLVAWNFYDPTNPLNQVDLVVTYDLKGARTTTIKTPSGEIKILSVKDLIDMKKKSGRPQDLEDVKALESL